MTATKALTQDGKARLTGMTTGGRVVRRYRVTAPGEFCRRCGRALVVTEQVTLATVGGRPFVPVCRGCRSFVEVR